MKHKSAPRFIQTVNAPWRMSAATDAVDILRDWDWATVTMPPVVPSPTVWRAEIPTRFANGTSAAWFTLGFAGIGSFVVTMVSDPLGIQDETYTSLSIESDLVARICASGRPIIGEIMQADAQSRRTIARCRIEAVMTVALAKFSLIAAHNDSHVFHLPGLDICEAWEWNGEEPVEMKQYGMRPDRWNTEVLKRPIAH